MQSASHLYNGAALFARKDRMSGNIIFNRLTHRHVHAPNNNAGEGGITRSGLGNARNGQYIPPE